MKTKYFLIGIMLTISTITNAQIKIHYGGNVSLGSTIAPPLGFKLQLIGNSVFSANTGAITSSAYIRGLNSYSTATNPDYSWYNNDQTGVFHPGSNNIGFSIAGIERLRINSSGNIGIGTSSPERLLTIGGSTNPIMGFKTIDGKGWSTYAQNDINFSIYEYTNTGWTGGYDRLTIYRGGKIGINGTATYGNLQINGIGNPNGLSVYNGSGIDINIYHNSDDNAYLTRGNNTNAGIRMLNNGHVGINGYASSNYWFYVTGDCRANTWSTYSDSIAKTDIQNISNSERIMELRPVSFKWKENENLNTSSISSTLPDSNYQFTSCDTCIDSKSNPSIILEVKDNRLHYGFLAQEVQGIFPDVVTSDERGLLAIDYNAFIPMLVDCYKKMDTQIDALQEIIAKQQEEIQQLININEYSKKSISSLESNANSGAMLYQNNPNPFNESTIIKYSVPAIQSMAMINIYELQGKQIESYNITQIGQGEVRITASTLNAGIYIYNLIVDGNEVDSKRMILTK